MKIKVYTDIQQSKELAKILPLKSADMFYFCSPFDEEYFKNPRFGVAERNTDEIPCWSLAVLFNILPVYIDNLRLRMDKSDTDFSLWYEDLSTSLATDFDIVAKTEVDAFYEMIIKLHEQKLI